MILLSVGVAAVAAPIEVDKRIEYTTSLNSMAAKVMSWYGSLISSNERISFSDIAQEWDSYRSRYPEDITQIQITSTDLIKLGSPYQYQFRINSLLTFTNTSGVHSQSVVETFMFQVQPFSGAILKEVSRNSESEAKVMPTSTFNKLHYKAREFAYTWLAYLDGVDVLKSETKTEGWFDQALYTLKIGDKEISGSVVDTLVKRRKYLTKGGHLLRFLDVQKKHNESNVFVLNITLEWKGVNSAGIPVLAKIQQKIEYQLQENNAWKIILIKEKHLLPDIAPWTELLC